MCTQACTHASVHADYFLAGLGPYLCQMWSDQIDQIIFGIRRTCHTCHTMCLHAQAHISGKLCHFRDIKVTMVSAKHAVPCWACEITQAHKLACMHTIFFRARINISAKLCQMSKIKVSMESWDYFPHVWTYSRSCEGTRGPKSRLRPPLGAKGPKTALHRSKKEGCLGIPIF